MRQQIDPLIRLLILTACIWPSSYVRAAETAAEQSAPRISLCDALEAVGPGDRLMVTVSGVYKSGFEISILFDPEHRLCRLDVQPSTWVEFSPSALSKDPIYDRILRQPTASIRATAVTFEGELWGPKAVGEDDPTVPVMIAYANRVARRRYGHNNAFRTKFVVHSIHLVEAVRNSDIVTGLRHRPKEDKVIYPVVEDANIPGYPSRAQLAGIEGRVIVEVRVESGTVSDVTALSGDRLLIPDTLANVKTWKFGSEVSSTFITTFIYKLELRMPQDSRYPKLVLELPERVTIIGAANGW